MKPLLFLFDIDGTLLHTKGAGLCAFKQAAEEVVGYALRFRKSHFAGKVDYLIFKALFDNRPPSGKTLPDAWTDFKSRYLAYLTEVAKTPEDWIVYPGVREFLERIHGTHYCALLTGNVIFPAVVSVMAEKAVRRWRRKHWPKPGNIILTDSAESGWWGIRFTMSGVENISVPKHWRYGPVFRRPGNWNPQTRMRLWNA